MEGSNTEQISGGDAQKKAKKEKPANLVIPPKKPKLSKAERRALQEQQRAAKAQRQAQPADKSSGKNKGKQQNTASPVSNKSQEQNKPSAAPTQKSEVLAVNADGTKDPKQISVLAHLPPFRDPKDKPDELLGVQLKSSNIKEQLHPEILQTGRAYATGIICHSNPRCRAMLKAMDAAIQDYVPDDDINDKKDFRHAWVNKVLKPSFQFFTEDCRPHSVGMGNAFTFLKSAVGALDRDMELPKAKALLSESIDAYLQERIDYADLAIAKHACEKIVDDDVILTFGHSEAVRSVLVEASKSKQFRVIVCDARPLLTGKDMLLDLRQASLDCTYIYLNALSFVMKDVTKVFLGAEALMSDGSVLGLLGTACVALASQSVPVLVCSETYKISNRIQLESITNNELGNPSHVLEGPLGDNLRVISLTYDLTPASFVSGIITEMGILPPTSVAVLSMEMDPQQ